MITVIHSDEERFASLWLKGLKVIPGATPMYSIGVRSFDKEIFASDIINDDSFVVVYSDDVVALVPLYRFSSENGQIEYRYGGEYLRAPLIGCARTPKRYGEIAKFIFDHIDFLANENHVTAHRAMIEGVEPIEGRHYYNYLTDYGYVDESTICQLIDITRSEQDLWADVRKSYRPLISRAKGNYDCELITSDSFNVQKCDEYRLLHFKAAGRQTRSLKSFELMYEMVKDSLGFIVLVRDKSGKTVASHFFYCCNIYCLYASSAIDGDLPSSSGIGHLGLWQGIMAARNLGCRYVDMGQLRLTVNPSEKEQNIALFKKGFGGHTVTVFRGTKNFQ